MKSMINPQVTIIVVPRERFSYTHESLESIYAYTSMPFKLVYVDGNSPRKIRQYLEAQAEEKGFTLIRTEYYLSPNHARNLGFAQVDTPYVVFVDNDVAVSPNWLEALVKCAEETDAAIVGPLTCQNEPLHQIVHCAGGETHVVVDVKGQRRMREKPYKQGQPVAAVRSKLHRSETEMAEFHCLLARTQMLQKLGGFDEQFVNSKEHVDFCMSAIEIGETVYFEPDSLVTYVASQPLKLTDFHFYMLRWSDAWELASLNHLRQKWHLSEDAYFHHKYKILGWRRKVAIFRPLVRQVTFGITNKFVEKALVFGLSLLDKVLNRVITSQYAFNQKHRRPEVTIVPPKLQEVALSYK
jgi:GT2 family glycosyltransferase